MRWNAIPKALECYPDAQKELSTPFKRSFERLKLECYPDDLPRVW